MKENISGSHSISINERKNIYINGVIKIDSFDEEEFLLETNQGYLAIKGEGLELIRLDTKDGVVSIKGLIISMSYIEDLKKPVKQSGFFEKVFKWV